MPGAGKIEKALHAILESNPNVYETEAAWRIAEQRSPSLRLGNHLPAAGTKLPRSIYQSVRRAVQGLVESGAIVRTMSKPERFEDLERRYPYRTHDLQERFLRAQLLPNLFTFAKTQHPTFDVAANERHVIGRLSDRATLRASWNELERPLAEAEYESKSNSIGSTLFQLRVKGTELFGELPVTHESAFVRLVKSFEPTTESERLLRGRLDAFIRDLPLGRLRLARLKSQLHQVLDMRESTRAVGLKEQAKDYLLSVAPGLVSSLPGHQAGQKPTDLEMWAANTQKTTFSPLLDKLVLRDAFQEFSLLRLA